MLRITINDTSQVRTLRLEGRVDTRSLQELERCWGEALSSSKSILQVDLTGVTAIDADGKTTLKTMHDGGAEFIAQDCLMIAVVEEIVKAAPVAPKTLGTRFTLPAHEEGKVK